MIAVMLKSDDDDDPKGSSPMKKKNLSELEIMGLLKQPPKEETQKEFLARLQRRHKSRVQVKTEQTNGFSAPGGLPTPPVAPAAAPGMASASGYAVTDSGFKRRKIETVD